MGACLSATGGGGMLVDAPDGDEEAFHKRFLEDHVLGEGEFGVVKMVHDMKSQDNEPLACKTLRKGVTFKDNTLYAPLKPEVLRGEINMLRALRVAGGGGDNNYCLQLHSIFETPRLILLVTELCAGGEMMEYVAKQEQDLRTEDVSRIAFQLLSAVDHCAQHNIIHRDIKPENCMFKDPSPKAELRLIDFGSGVMDDPDAPLEEGQEFGRHTTFAGSAFYISPEMFQRTYTQKTDVWSAGVTLYVLACGYPADCLQKCFNILQTSKGRDLKSLPNLPPNMPDSFLDMLEGLLVYRHKKRISAGEMLTHEFVTFHKDLEQEEEGISFEDIAATAAGASGQANAENQSTSKKMGKAQSVQLSGSVLRHGLMLGYQKFERSFTTLLATMLPESEFDKLIKLLDARQKAASRDGPASTEEAAPANGASSAANNAPGEEQEQTSNREKLDIIQIAELKAILKDEIKGEHVLEMIAKLPNAANYNTFAYHIPLLKEFIRPTDDKGTNKHNKAGRDHTNPRAVRRGTYMGDQAVQNRGGSLHELTSRSDGDQPRRGSFRKDGSHNGPRARRTQSVKGA